MKQTVLLIYAVTIITTLTLSQDVTDVIAHMLESMSITRIPSCNKSILEPEDIMKIEQLIEDRASITTIDLSVDKRILKVGCLINCIFQERDIIPNGRIRVDRIMEYLDIILKENYALRLRHILNECSDEIQSTDECEISIKFFLCACQQARH